MITESGAVAEGAAIPDLNDAARPTTTWDAQRSVSAVGTFGHRHETSGGCISCPLHHESRRKPAGR